MSEVPEHNPATTVTQPVPNATDDDTRDASIFRVSDTRFLVVLAIVMAGLMAIQIARSGGWGAEPVQIQRLSATDVNYQINVNHSTWIEWAQLPNIGETTARRIVADRDTNGPFRSVEDVGRVSGIGPRTLANLRQWLKCDSDETIATMDR